MTDFSHCPDKPALPNPCNTHPISRLSRLLRPILWTVALCLFVFDTQGQIEVVEVKDINPGEASGIISSSFNDAKVIGDLLFFKANDGVHGEELWISDGTAEGTHMVMDINPGSGTVSSNSFTPFNGLVFFQADDGVSGRELWVTDGTEAGTELFLDINSGSGHGSPLYFTEFNGKLYFGANNGTNGQELWVSDGTAAGTHMVKDIQPGFTGSGPNLLTVMNNELFFRANDGVHGTELWKTDGTEAGTVMVKDINEGDDGNPLYLTVFNGELFFIVNDGIHGHELWKTDGTEAGTQLVKDSNPGPNGIVGANFVSPPAPVEYNGKLYFASINMEHLSFVLWETDGTEAGTKKFELTDGSELRWPDDMTVFDGMLYLSAYTAEFGEELWRSDGTPEGTVMVKDINPGTSQAYPAHFTPYNGNLFFTASDGSSDHHLWMTDGTEAGTVKLLPPFATQTNPVNTAWNPFREVGGRLLFPAEYADIGLELYAVVDPTVGVAYQVEFPFKIFPNPAVDVLSVQFGTKDDPVEIAVINQLGQVVLRHNHAGGETLRIPIANLNGGIYLLHVKTERGMQTRTFVKM